MKVLQVRNWAHIKPETNQDREQIVRSLILQNTHNDDQIHLWRDGEDDTLYVPTEFLSPPTTVEEKNWKRYKFKFEGTLRPGQELLGESYLQYIRTHNGGIIKSPVGSGKTIITMAIMSTLNWKTLVIVPTDYLMGQWREQLKLFLQLKEPEIGICRQNICDYKSKKVVIGMIHSLAKQGRYPAELYNEFGLVIVDECLHPSHELLTLEGWKSLDKITREDKIAQVNSETHEVTFVLPLRVIKRKFKGNLIGFKTKQIDLLGTPNHKHLVYKYSTKIKNKPHSVHKVKFTELNPTSRWKHILAGRVSGGDRLSRWERFCIAFQADGCCVYSNKQEYCLRFAFRRPRKIEQMIELLGGLSVRWKKSENSRGDTIFTVWSKVLPSKNLDWVSFTKSSTYYQDILNELYLWDGSKHSKGSTKFYYNTEENLNIAQAIAVLAGKVSNLQNYSAGEKKRYQLSWSEQSYYRDMGGVYKYEQYYDGDVYCVEVPSGNIVTRRGGRVIITGNCHKLSAPTFSQSLPQFWSKYRLGLSATPRRKDGYENVFRYHIGDICNPDTAQSIKPDVYIIRYDNIESHHSGCVWGGALSLGRYYNKIAKIWHRNNMIANITVALAKKGKDVLVLSDRLLQLEALDSLLRQSGIDDIGIFTGQKKKGLDRKILLATYGSAGLGADIPRLSAVVFATPRVDVEQPMGRVLREAKDEPQIVVDIIDTRSTIMQQWGYARMHFYKKNAGKIIYKEVKVGD